MGVGTLRNVKFLSGNGALEKLKGETWFDIERTKKIDKDLPQEQRIINRLRNGQPVEVSTGLYTDNEPAPQGANFRGKPYTHIARNYRPDHLAILPNQTGACSVNDGCGVLVNANPEGHNQYSTGAVTQAAHDLSKEAKAATDKAGEKSGFGRFSQRAADALQFAKQAKGAGSATEARENHLDAAQNHYTLAQLHKSAMGAANKRAAVAHKAAGDAHRIAMDYHEDKGAAPASNQRGDDKKQGCGDGG
jgi:hypothetical protein